MFLVDLSQDFPTCKRIQDEHMSTQSIGIRAHFSHFSLTKPKQVFLKTLYFPKDFALHKTQNTILQQRGNSLSNWFRYQPISGTDTLEVEVTTYP